MEDTVLIQVPQAELRQVDQGQHTAPAQPAEGPFSINCLDVGQETKIRAQVGRPGVSWDVLSTSQTLKAGELTYIFSTPGGGRDVFYAVTLGADTEPEAVGILEAVLENVSLLRESERLMGDPAAQTGEAALAQGVTYRYGLARGVHRASSSIASGLMVSASYASDAFEKASGYLQTGEPTNAPVQVSEGFKRRIGQTAAVAQWLAKAANSVVVGLAWLGGKVAGGVLWAVGADKPLQPGEEAGLMRELAAAGASGFTEVWDSMEQAGFQVLTSARDNTARVVEHRYGAEAGAASAEGLNAAGYAADAFWSTSRIGVRAVAKSAAKKTAKGVIRKWAGQGGAGPAASGSSAGGSSAAGSRGGSGSASPAAAAAGAGPRGASPARGVAPRTPVAAGGAATAPAGWRPGL